MDNSFNNILKDFAMQLKTPHLLDNDKIASLLPGLDEFIQWAKQVQEYALTQALKGVKFKGFKVVEGRSRRTFSNELEVANTLLEQGYDESVVYKKELANLTSIESLLGKKKFQEVLGAHVTKAPGKPTLVSDSDPRAEYSNDFQIIDNDNDWLI
jgi:hypothetical protein